MKKQVIEKKFLRVFFEITNYCNFNCIYCFASPCKKNSIIMPLDKFRKIVDTLSTLEDWDFTALLTGGEPLSVNNICDYGRYVKKYAKKVTLGSNGSFIPTLRQEQLNDIKEVIEEISISFDATNHELFKKMTNHSVEPVLEAIDILNKNEIKIKLTPVVTKYNIDFDGIIKFCEERNIKKIRFYWFIPRKTNDHSLAPTEKDYEYMMEKFNNYKGNIDLKINRYYYPTYATLIISPNGDIGLVTDLERKNIEIIGSYDNFIDNLKMILKQHHS
ncbi:MAG TPA: radical SAM protein [Rickettsiales bacterium]|nr:radical SAM protein [Rickettsiales bacterium]